MQRNDWSRKLTWGIVVIGVFTLAAYSNAMLGEFVSDDRVFLVNNPKITAAAIPEYFTSGFWSHTHSTIRDVNYYRPLVLVMYTVNHALWGQNAIGYHLVNILLHMANSILLFIVLLLLPVSAGRLIPPLVGALAFALHPVHVESVSWISGLTDVLATFFLLASFICYLRFRERNRRMLLAASLVTYGLSLLSKEIAITYPLVLIAYEAVKEREYVPLRVSPYLALAAVYLFVRRMILGAISPLDFHYGPGWKDAFVFFLGYVKNLFIPWPQYLYLSVPENGYVSLGSIVFGLCAASLFTYLSCRETRRKDVILLAIAVFVLPLLPALSAAFYVQRPMFALRFLYLPSVSLAIFLTWLLGYTEGRYAKLLPALCAVLLLGYGVMTFGANRMWRNDEVLYTRMLEVTPRYAGAYIRLARYFERTSQADKAIESYSKAGQFAHGVEQADAYEGMGLLYGKRGDPVMSEHYYRKVLDIDQRRSGAWVGLGNNAALQERYQDALFFYNKALEHDPDNAAAHSNLAVTYRMLNDPWHAAYYDGPASQLRSPARR